MDMQIDKPLPGQFGRQTFFGEKGHNSPEDSDEENGQLPYKLTISEYDEIAQRFEDCKKQVGLIQDAIATPSNLKALRERIERECEQMTLRVVIIKKSKSKESITLPEAVTDVYKVEIVNLERRGYLLLKHHKSRKMEFESNSQYLIDKVKLIVNPKGEVILISTSLTVLRVETEDTYSVESMELSQKQRDGRNEANGGMHNSVMGFMGSPQIAKYTGLHRPNMVPGNEQTRNEQARKQQQMEVQNQAQDTNRLPPYIMADPKNPESLEPQVFTSTKQIQQESQRVLTEWSNKNQVPSLWGFRDLLTWKIPDHLLSTAARESQIKLKRKQEEMGYVCSYVNNTHLFQYDLVTQRVKEQKVTFVGIVMHVKQFNKDMNQNDKGGLQQVTSHIDLESTNDKSKVALFVKHNLRLDLKATLKRGHILLVKDALRKISNQIDIYTQLMFNVTNFRIIGEVKDQMADFQANNTIQLIKTIPTDQIVRHIIKILGFIAEVQFIKINYKCDKCSCDLNNESICRSGCFVNNPKLNMQTLCQVQDGTAKASLELKNERVLTAFKVTEDNQRLFKDYCLKFGAFQHPSSTHNPMYREVLNVFKKYETWQQMIFYCKPYAKASNEKRNQQSNLMNVNGPGQGGGYGDTISKPTFILKEKEKEIFLNGEMQLQKKTHGYGEMGRMMKKTCLCLKGLSVETSLNPEALRNTYAIKQLQEQADGKDGE